MNARSSIAPDPSATWTLAALQQQVAMLEELAGIGLRIARSIEARAAETPATETAMAFSRVARAVRMTALLQSKLIRDLDEAKRREARVREQEAEDAAEEADDEAERQDPAYRHKARVEAIVVRVARAEDDNEDRIERIIQETGERLDDEDIYGDVLTRPVGELVALICRDLGLEPDWGRLSQEAWAIAEGITVEGPPSLSSPLPPGGGEVGREGDASLRRDAQLLGHPHPLPFPHQGGREMQRFKPPPS